MRSRLPLTLLVCLLIAGDVIAQQSANTFAATCTSEPKPGSLSKADLTVMGFAIGSATLADVQKRFPATVVKKLSSEEESDTGVCIKNPAGNAVVFATGVMGDPVLTGVYLLDASKVEGTGLRCAEVDLPAEQFATQSGIRAGAANEKLARIADDKIAADGSFCVSKVSDSRNGVLKIGRDARPGLHNGTGILGESAKGRVQWVYVWGIASE